MDCPLCDQPLQSFASEDGLVSSWSCPPCKLSKTIQKTVSLGDLEFHFRNGKPMRKSFEKLKEERFGWLSENEANKLQLMAMLELEIEDFFVHEGRLWTKENQNLAEDRWEVCGTFFHRPASKEEMEMWKILQEKVKKDIWLA